MWSENDDKFMWLFRGTITIELLNQKGDSKHYLQTLQFSDDKDDLMNAGVTDHMKISVVHEHGSVYFRASVCQP